MWRGAAWSGVRWAVHVGMWAEEQSSRRWGGQRGDLPSLAHHSPGAPLVGFDHGLRHADLCTALKHSFEQRCAGLNSFLRRSCMGCLCLLQQALLQLALGLGTFRLDQLLHGARHAHGPNARPRAGAVLRKRGGLRAEREPPRANVSPRRKRCTAKARRASRRAPRAEASSTRLPPPAYRRRPVDPDRPVRSDFPMGNELCVP